MKRLLYSTVACSLVTFEDKELGVLVIGRHDDGMLLLLGKIGFLQPSSDLHQTSIQERIQTIEVTLFADFPSGL